jgi:hypothetical protein
MTAKKGGTNGAVAASLSEDPMTVLVHPDLRELTVGQIEEIEDLTDIPLTKVFDVDLKQGKTHRAIVFVIKKEHDPSFTWEQAAKYRLAMINPQFADDEEDGDGSAVPPTNGRGSSTRSRSASTSRGSAGRTSKA